MAALSSESRSTPTFSYCPRASSFSTIEPKPTEWRPTLPHSIDVTGTIAPPPRSSRAGATIIVAAVAALSLVMALPHPLRIGAIAALVLLLPAAIAYRAIYAVHVIALSLLWIALVVAVPLFRPWPFVLLVPLLAYAAVVIAVAPLRRAVGWMRLGRLDRGTQLLMLATVAVSAVALMAWVAWTKPDLGHHLALVPAALRALRPDVRIAHFWHIPFAQPDYLRMLPDEWSRALLEGLLAADLVGFQTSRWADAFRWGCRDVLSARTGEKWIKFAGHMTRIGVYPVGIHGNHLQAAAASPAIGAERKLLADWVGGRRFILRVDRTELSKNIYRGMLAVESLLERRADLRGRIAHLALLAPSRGDVPEYVEYTQQCVEVADRINARFGADTVRVDIENSINRAYAAYGGVYIAASLAWLWLIEGSRPDRWDLIGAAICLVGAGVILLGPRPA